MAKGETVAIITYGKTPITGYNSYTKTSPAWGREYPDGNESYTRHAEMHALQQLNRILRKKRAGAKLRSVHIFRKGKDGKPTMAAPCVHCQKRLAEAGLSARDVWYTDWDGCWTRLWHWDWEVDGIMEERLEKLRSTGVWKAVDLSKLPSG